MQEVGFEPTPPKRILPESTALDHSATLSLVIKSRESDKEIRRSECDQGRSEKKSQE